MLRVAAAVAVGAGAAATQEAAAPARPALVTFADNGVWCWYQDERVVVDTSRPDGPQLVLSTIRFTSDGHDGHGDVDVHWYDVDAGAGGTFELHDRLQPDDHDGAALWVRPDGRYVALYTKHSSDALVRWRVSERPHDASAWRPEQTFENAVRVCYSNVFELVDKGGKKRLFDFSRADGFDPNWFVSDDGGDTWQYGGKLHTGPDGNGAHGQRPYLKYAAHGDRELHFVTTDGHPRDEDNSVYHGVLRRGVLHGSDGKRLGDLSRGREAELRSPDFTPVLRTGDTFGGVAMKHAWTIDLHVDARGNPFAALTARADGDDTDHRFLYARWTGRRWQVHDIAPAGAYLYRRENDYTGLVALHPHDPDLVFVSSKVDPRDDRELANYELFRGRRRGDGDVWTWRPVTWDSGVDNLRPVVPIWDADHTALLWLRGGMRTYTDWNAAVVGHVGPTADVDTWCTPGQPEAERPAVPRDR